MTMREKVFVALCAAGAFLLLMWIYSTGPAHTARDYEGCQMDTHQPSC